MLPSVSIVLPTYQGIRWLSHTLPAIYSQTYPAPFEVIAIDSASSDGTMALLNDYGATVISIPQERFTHGYARNLGVQRAQTELLIFLSQDAIPVGKDWLEKMAHLLDDPLLGAAYARQLPRPEATPPEMFFQSELYPSQNRRFAWQTGQPMPISALFFSNVCSIARRELCLAYPFRQDLIMSEDQAFAKALLMAGYQTLYSADVAVVHSHHYDRKTLFRRNFDSAYSLKGITDDDASDVIQAGLNYLYRETRFLIDKRSWGWLATLPSYELMRILGRILGSHADRLPLRWRIYFSLHQQFWLRA